MRTRCRDGILVLLTGAVLAGACGEQVELGVALEDAGSVAASVRRRGLLKVHSILLYRSTSPLDGEIDTIAMPVTVLRFPLDESDAVLVDSMVAHNVTYYYRARVRRGLLADMWSNVDSVRVPDVAIGTGAGPSLLVDKIHYFLEVRDGGGVRKRYPVALGGRPRNRKLCLDRASTPEGVYRIVGAQPRATFYKAFDLDYPNRTDRARYDVAREAGLIEDAGAGCPPIGGEIQIHGQGIGSNWTFGCIALRNPDIDELFGPGRVGRGTPVYIVGSEVSRRDLAAMVARRSVREVRSVQRRLRRLGFYDREPDGIIGPDTRRALGRFQRSRGLVPGCDFDAGTVRLLEELD